MNNKLQEYLVTGMLGAYHPENAVLRKAGGGGVETLFRDTSYWVQEDCLVQKRQIVIGGKRFSVTSVFPDRPTATPTDKLLALIDMELKKEAQNN